MNDLTIPLDRRPLVGSFTLLKTFRDVCEHQAYRRYIRKDVRFTKTEASEFGNTVHAAFKERNTRKVPLPWPEWEKHAEPFDQFPQVKCEFPLGITKEGRSVGYWDGSTWFRGKIDNVVVIPPKALITDWKTGTSKYEDPFELECFALLLKARYPDLTKIVGRYVYLKEDRIGQMHDLSEFEHTWQEIHRLMSLMEWKRKTGEWIKRKSGLCGYCDVADCENRFSAR